jgi:protein-tyrosine-phosphatase
MKKEILIFLFVCKESACRSRIAQGFFNRDTLEKEMLKLLHGANISFSHGR